MLNYIRSECYRALRRKGYMIFFGILALLAVLVNILATGDTPFNTTATSMTVVLNMFNSVTLLTLAVSDLVFSDEHKHQTMKNALAFGYSKTDIYIGKFLTQVILAFVLAVLLFGIYLIATYVLLENPAEAAPTVRTFFLTLLGSVPVWLGSLALGNAVLFLVKNSTASGFLFAGLIVLPEPILAIIGLFGKMDGVCAALSKNLLWTQIGQMTGPFFLSGTVPGIEIIGRVATVGIVHMIVFLIIGLMLFRKKEI